jgi:hypothetical protein
VNPLYIALVLLSFTTLAIAAVAYTAKSRRQVALSLRPKQLAHSDEGSVVVPVRNSASTSRAAKKLELFTANQEQAVALDQKVDDTIRRLILMN